MIGPWGSDEFRDEGYAAINWVADYLAGVRERPVLSTVEPGEIGDQLPLEPPGQGEPFSAVLRDLDQIIMPGITHWNHPRFFAYYMASAPEPAILAELLTAALNVNTMLWRTSPAATELEQRVMSWLTQLTGLGDGWTGQIHDSASLGTIIALATAQARAPERSVVVCSEHAHSCVARACKLLGLELRISPSDAHFRLDPAQLDLTDACAVVATIGTTSTAAVDPLRATGEACRAAGAWFHVDGAYGGSGMVCPELRDCIDGIELVDSIVISPQKWLFVPLNCSTLFTRHHEAVRETFSLIPEYLRTSEDEVTNFQEQGVGLGRRFRALTLWTVLRCYGREGLQTLQRDHIRFAQRFERRVVEDARFALAAPRSFALVCFRLDGTDADNEELMRRVNESGELFISHTRLHGQIVLRFAIGHVHTTEDDIDVAWERIDREARAIHDQRRAVVLEQVAA